MEGQNIPLVAKKSTVTQDKSLSKVIDEKQERQVPFGG